MAESGHVWDFWIAFWTAALTMATFSLVAVGFIQLRALREDAILGRTLDQCNRYQVDPILDACLRRLKEGHRTRRIDTNSAEYRLDVASVLNYLDSLVLGCEHGIYLERIARVYMQKIIEFHFQQYLGPNATHIDGLDPKDYMYLSKYRAKWSGERPLWFRRSA